MNDFRHPKDGYVFIVTYGRSGSTLLQRLVNAIPGVMVRGENNNALLPLFKSWQALTQSPDIGRMRAQGLTSDATHPWFGAERIDTDAYGHTLCRGFAAQVLRPQANLRVCGFKEIRTIAQSTEYRAYLEFKRRFFPNARFVFNTRDSAAVARSSWWRSHDPADVMAMIHTAEAVFRGFVATYPDRSIMLHYDSYIADHGAFGPLFDLLGDQPSRADLRAIMTQRLIHAT